MTLAYLPSAWTPEMVRRISATPETTVPTIDPARLPAGSKVMPGYHLWDFWPVMRRDDPTVVARVDGWLVLIGLTAPATLLPEARHDVATHRALVSRDGETWRDAGPVFPDGAALGSRQWAGAAWYDDVSGEISVLYTAAGDAADAGVSFAQRIAHARARMVSGDDGPRFESWTPHRVVLEGDGARYRRARATGAEPGMIDAFRDPFLFRDPRTGAEYLLFTATLPDSPSPWDGAVGIAEARSDDLTAWELLPPLLHAEGVNNELERPHLVARDGRLYLFFCSHPGTFAPGLVGPEGLYGFVAEELSGPSPGSGQAPWRPLNGSGLVLGNPPEAMYQSYSWLVLPNLKVLSFLDYTEIGTRDVAAVTREPPAYQLTHFGGTYAPTLTLALDGDRAWLAGEEYALRIS